MPVPPFISIVIATYNRPERLRQCLQSLTGLDYPADSLEVVVVDDGSPQDLQEIVQAFHKQLNIQFFRQDNAGPATARNKGARHACGEYLAFIDDDCLPAPDWLTHLACQLEKTPDRMLGGKTVNYLKDNRFSAASQFIVDIVYQHFNPKPDEATFLASNNMLVPAAAYREIGGFPVVFPRAGGEDRELCDRWLWKGYKISYVEEAVVYHAHYLSFSKYCQQHFAYGTGAYHFHRIRKKRQSGNMSSEMQFHTNLKNWLLAPFTGKEKNAFSLFFLLMVWQVANLAGFLWAAWFERELSR